MSSHRAAAAPRVREGRGGRARLRPARLRPGSENRAWNPVPVRPEQGKGLGRAAYGSYFTENCDGYGARLRC